MAVTGWGEQGWDEDGFGGLISANVNVSGVSGSGELGEETPKTVQIAIPTGVAATGSVGAEEVDTNREWGIGDWNQSQLGWGGENLDVEVFVPGVEASGLLGDEEAPQGDANVNVTSVLGTFSIGTLRVEIQQNLAVSGLEATGTAGTASSGIFVDVSLTGVEGTGETGTLSITGDALVSPTGVFATATEGDPTINGAALVSPTGVEGVGYLGEETARGAAIIIETGVSAEGTVGTVVGRGGTIATPTGVSATGTIDDPLVWGGINTSQTPNWVEIDTNAA